jgi:hypothetical protein
MHARKKVEPAELPAAQLPAAQLHLSIIVPQRPPEVLHTHPPAASLWPLSRLSAVSIGSVNPRNPEGVCRAGMLNYEMKTHVKEPPTQWILAVKLMFVHSTRQCVCLTRRHGPSIFRRVERYKRFFSMLK